MTAQIIDIKTRKIINNIVKEHTTANGKIKMKIDNNDYLTIYGSSGLLVTLDMRTEQVWLHDEQCENNYNETK